MKKIDVSVILNLHREASYLAPTLLSLNACADEARKTGLVVELVVVFDRADEATRAVFHSTPLTSFASIRSIDVDCGSLGLARNAGIEAAAGEFIWTADGDDLASRNAINELVNTARAHPDRDVAVFVEFLAAFGEHFHVARYFNSEYLTVADFVFQHPYVSRVFLRRSIFREIRYKDLRVTSGYAYEDWDLNAQLLARGFEFVVAPRTVFFYRQRGNSLLKQANAQSARIIPHSELFSPAVFCQRLADDRKKIGAFAEFGEGRRKLFKRNFAAELLSDDALRKFVFEAAQLDPEIEPSRIAIAGSYSPVPWSVEHWGFQLEKLFRIVGNQTFSDVVVLPWLKPGGAEKYILSILSAIQSLDPDANILVISGESAARHEWEAKLPPQSTFLDVYNAFPMLNDIDRDAMTVRMLLANAREKARLHIKASIFGHRFLDAYCAVLADHLQVIYYRFCDDRLHSNGHSAVSPWAVKFLRRHVSAIKHVICDCRSIAQDDDARICVGSEKYRVLYAQCDAVPRALVGETPRFRLVWASRVNFQKRPELLSPLVAALRRRLPDICIDVFGQCDTQYDPAALFSSPGLSYYGDFDGLSSLPLGQYDAFVYTSHFDGLPNILLEALGAGLPVIAPDVGGVSEAVINGETGYLVPDIEDERLLIEAYVEAICRLYSDWNRAHALSEGGVRLVASRHCRANLVESVGEIFGLRSRATAGL